MLPPEPGVGLISERRARYSEQLGADALRFRELIGKLGSGERTSTGLSRDEAAEALDRLLEGRVSDAQAAAFLIAHRLRRPEPQELAGLIDSYRRQGPTLLPAGRRVVSFGVPFDGRCRTAPLLPLTALLLASAGLGVVLHGGDPMPVKYGLSHGEALAALGLELRQLAWPAVQAGFASCGLALLHQPRHFAGSIPPAAVSGPRCSRSCPGEIPPRPAPARLSRFVVVLFHSCGFPCQYGIKQL
jgi:hypothetical protein